jgi:hypothetical protein
MLVLFDIDGTLLRSRGVGLRAMKAALESLHPARFEGDVHDLDAIDTAGRLDPLIWRELLEQRGLEPTDSGHDAFRETYGRLMAEMIEAEQPVIELAGAADAVAWTRDHPRLIPALLTGNYPETGRLPTTSPSGSGDSRRRPAADFPRSRLIARLRTPGDASLHTKRSSWATRPRTSTAPARPGVA